MTKVLNNILYYHPLPLNNEGDSGSRVRPLRMLTAFKNLGYSVTEVTGHYEHRKEIIKNNVFGKKFLFCYGESANTPFVLTNRYHFPLFNSYDHKFFRFLKNNKIPSGIFFRDMYWFFDYYKKHAKFHRRFYNRFWLHELKTYKENTTALFLPTRAMKYSIPIDWAQDTIYSLPPGCASFTDFDHLLDNSDNNILRLLYIGNIAPPLYDLRSLFRIVSENKNIELEIICRKSDWEKHKEIYRDYLRPNIKLFHKSGDLLIEHYSKADVFVTYRNHHPYLDLTMPIKIHEAWSYGLPVIVKSGGIDAKWVERLKGGWVVNNDTELINLFSSMKADRNQLTSRKTNVKKLVDEHSWEKRASYVEKILLGTGSVDKTFF